MHAHTVNTWLLLINARYQVPHKTRPKDEKSERA